MRLQKKLDNNKIINPQRIYLRISSVIRTAEVLQYANFEGGLIMAA
jgi:hypothetical protein